VGVIVGATETDPVRRLVRRTPVQDPVDFPAPSKRPAVESVVSQSQGVVAYPGRGGLSEDASADPATDELPVVEPEHITETTCRIPVISSADMTGPIPRITGELFTPTTPSGDGRVDAAEPPPAAPLTPDSGFWGGDRSGRRPPVRRVAGDGPARRLGLRLEPGGGGPGPGRSRVGGAGRGRARCRRRGRAAVHPGRSARETGRVAVPDAGPVTAPIPAIGPESDEHLTGPVADEPITDSFAACPSPRPTPAAPSAATPTVPRWAA
jgi:hypothetical protein